MSLLKDMQVKFPKSHKQWAISHLSNQTRLTRHLQSEKYEFSVIQEIIISESKKENNFFKIKLMTPTLIHIESDLETEDEFSLKQVDFTTSYDFNANSTSGFFDYVVYVEKETLYMPIKEILCYHNIVSNLCKIAIKED